MLYAIFSFFGASIGGALGLVLGPFAFRSFNFDALIIPGLSDGQSGFNIINEFSVGILLGAIFGGVIGLIFARRISCKKQISPSMAYTKLYD